MRGSLSGAPENRSAAIASSFAAAGEKGHWCEKLSEAPSSHCASPDGFRNPCLSHSIRARGLAAAQLPQPMHRPEATMSRRLILPSLWRGGGPAKLVEGSLAALEDPSTALRAVPLPKKSRGGCRSGE